MTSFAENVDRDLDAPFRAGGGPASPSPAALVLGSGGARGAYEVGVARFLFEDLRARLGRSPNIGIITGTSAGALNALGLAAYADEPLRGVSFLANRWIDLRLDHMIRPRRLELLRLAGSLGCPGPATRLRDRGGALDPRPFRKLVSESSQLCEAESELEADLLSYLLFDGPFAASLMELGYADARSQADELAALFTPLPFAGSPAD